MDPVPKGLGFIWRMLPWWSSFPRPRNAAIWVNSYEKYGGTLLIVGHRVSGADENANLTQEARLFVKQHPRQFGLTYGGHLAITRLPTVAANLKNDISGVPTTTRSNRYK